MRYKYTLRCNYFSARSAYTVFPLEKRLNRYACRKGVTANGQQMVSRCKSTDSTTLASRFQKLRKILYDFYLGGKRLFQDVKLTWKIRRKLRKNNWEYNVLERKELWKMIKTQKNLMKTFPIVALSCLPVIGYLGPIIGFLKPRKFLSDHFWTAKQKSKFIVLDNKERAECQSAIFNIINEETKKPGSKEHQLLHKMTARADLDDDAPFEKTFLAFSSGTFELNNLKRKHLQKLCSFWIMRSLWPTSMLKRNLQKEMAAIHKDDVALSREGIQALNEEQLKEACHVRGLDASNMSLEDLQFWLRNWLGVSKDVTENETSFLAHHAVFKATNVQETFKDSSTI